MHENALISCKRMSSFVQTQPLKTPSCAYAGTPSNQKQFFADNDSENVQMMVPITAGDINGKLCSMP